MELIHWAQVHLLSRYSVPSFSSDPANSDPLRTRINTHFSHPSENSSSTLARTLTIRLLFSRAVCNLHIINGLDFGGFLAVWPHERKKSELRHDCVAIHLKSGVYKAADNPIMSVIGIFHQLRCPLHVQERLVEPNIDMFPSQQETASRWKAQEPDNFRKFFNEMRCV